MTAGRVGAASHITGGWHPCSSVGAAHLTPFQRLERATAATKEAFPTERGKRSTGLPKPSPTTSAHEPDDETDHGAEGACHESGRHRGFELSNLDAEGV